METKEVIILSAIATIAIAFTVAVAREVKAIIETPVSN